MARRTPPSCPTPPVRSSRPVTIAPLGKGPGCGPRWIQSGRILRIRWGLDATHQVGVNLADPEWANLALSGSIISDRSPVLRKIARRYRPLHIAPSATADSYEVWEILRERRMAAVRSVGPPANQIGSRRGRRRGGWDHGALAWLRLEFAEVDQRSG